MVKRSKRNGNKKVMRHKACQSEFDYQGWKTWGNWRRSVVEQTEAEAKMDEMLNGDGMILCVPDEVEPEQQIVKDRHTKDCWNTCDYPSECRWGKKVGVESSSPEKAVTVTVPSSKPSSSAMETEHRELETLDDISMIDAPEASVPSEDDTVSRTPFTSPEEETRKPSMDELLESVKRRKRRSAGLTPSPLASNPPSATGPEDDSSTAGMLQKAFDDFELDFQKSFGRAVTGLIGGRRGSDGEESSARGK